MQLRRLLLACIAQVCFAAMAIAGDSTGINKFTVGAEAGVGTSGLNGGKNTVSYSRAMPAASVGLTFRYNFNRVFSVGTGLYYHRINFGQSFSYENYGDYPDAFQAYGLNYISLPVLFRAAAGKKVKFIVDAGGYVSVLAKPTPIIFYPNYEYDPFTQPTNVRSLDFGITFALGLSIPVSRHFGITIQERNSFGFQKLISILDTWSCMLQVGGTYSFGGRKRNNW